MVQTYRIVCTWLGVWVKSYAKKIARKINVMTKSGEINP